MSHDWWNHPPYVRSEEERALSAARRSESPLTTALFTPEVIRFACPTDARHRPLEMILPRMRDMLERNGVPPIRIMCDCCYIPGVPGEQYLLAVIQIAQDIAARSERAYRTHRSEWTDGYPPAPDLSDLTPEPEHHGGGDDHVPD